MGQGHLRRLGRRRVPKPHHIFPRGRDERRLLRAMGRETANTHWTSSKSLPAVTRHLDGLDQGWLLTAARTMAKAVRQEWNEWRAARKGIP